MIIMYSVTSNTIANTYLLLVDKVMSRGEMILDERGDKIKELLNVVSVIKEPLKNNFYNIPDAEVDIPKGFPFGKNELAIYRKQFLDPDKRGFVYTYGERLCHYKHQSTSFFGDKVTYVNQIDEIIKKLNNNNYTRRATAITWSPYLDNSNDNVPCLITLDAKIRDNKLNMTILYRSHDALLGWFPNIYGLAYVGKHIIENVKQPITMGPMTVHSISAHIRDTDLPLANNILKQNVYK